MAADTAASAGHDDHSGTAATCDDYFGAATCDNHIGATDCDDDGDRSTASAARDNDANAYDDNGTGATAAPTAVDSASRGGGDRSW